MPDSRSTPSKIGRYTVTRLIGRGAMGEVYLGRDAELARDVAIKVVRLPPLPKDQQTYLERFRNEAKAVGRLRHPSIVAVHDVGEDPEHGPYLVFDFVDGMNLKDALRTRGVLAPAELVALAEQVGSALDAAHREGIIHRDIKPENLLLGPDGQVHLADFGVARVPDAQLTTEGQFLGTPCYAAPESLMGREATRASDQFSFGAVLYEALSGVRAFPGKEAVVVAHAVIHQAPAPLSQVAVPRSVVPAEVEAVIARAMHKDPALRYGTLGALVLALRMAYADAGVLPRPDHSQRLRVDAQRLRGDGQSASEPPEEAPARLPLWPFAAALLVGGVAVVQVGGFGDALWGPGTEAGALPSTDASVAALSSADAAEAGAAEVVDGPLPDAQAPAANSEPDTSQAAEPTAFEREEGAKDALEHALDALKSGDLKAAAAAADEAYRLDPENPDVLALREKLR
jgi:tRNA A-37 threonylcarbamoyl transferase component Bud32